MKLLLYECLQIVHMLLCALKKADEDSIVQLRRGFALVNEIYSVVKVANRSARAGAVGRLGAT